MTCAHAYRVNEATRTVTCANCPLSVVVVHPDEREPDELTDAERRFRDAITPTTTGQGAQLPKRYRDWADRTRAEWARKRVKRVEESEPTTRRGKVA